MLKNCRTIIFVRYCLYIQVLLLNLLYVTFETSSIDSDVQTISSNDNQQRIFVSRLFYIRTIMILGHSTTSFDLSLIIYAFDNPLCENNTRTRIRFRICFLSDIRCEFSEPVHRSSCSSIARASFVN